MKLPDWMKALFWAVLALGAALLGIALWRVVQGVLDGKVDGAGDPFRPGPTGKIIVSTAEGDVLVPLSEGKKPGDVRAVKVAQGVATVENKSQPFF